MSNVFTLHATSLKPISQHPGAVAGRQRAAVRVLEKEKIKYAISTQGVHFHTVGAYTFCYRVDRRNVIEVASSIRNPADPNDPHTGRAQALDRFMSGRRMLMRTLRGMSARQFLNLIFSW